MMNLQNLPQYNWKLKEIEKRAEEERGELGCDLIEFVGWLLSLAPTTPTGIFTKCFLAVERTGTPQYDWWVKLITTGKNYLDFKLPRKSEVRYSCPVRAYYGYTPGLTIPRELGEYWNSSSVPAMEIHLEKLKLAWADHIALELRESGILGGYRLYCTLVR